MNRPQLNGHSILRFAHAFESGGGTERYLDDLDRTLLERNAMTIIRLHLTRQSPPSSVSEQSTGRGRLIRVPLPIQPGQEDSSISHEGEPGRQRVKRLFRDWVLYSPLVWAACGRRWTSCFPLTPRPGQAIGAGHAASGVFKSRPVDLVMLHFFGGADAEEVLMEARRASVPVALLNHYSNDRYLHLAIRKHALLADAVAGVNGLQVPRYLRNRLVNLSDGIDTEFFRRERAQPIPNPPSSPVILLPARVTREKGQLDLLQAMGALQRSGVYCCIALAGRVDSSGFVDELRQTAGRLGSSDRVQLLGDLSVHQLRDWYAASAVVAFPTYHHEGLGRVIVEAQAMGVPVVAYATGGVPEGIEDGKTGYLVRSGDISGLADRLKRLLSSPSIRESMGLAGRKAAEERFSLTALAERHECFYGQILAAKRQAQGAQR